jgi:hypothetical protein
MRSIRVVTAATLGAAVVVAASPAQAGAAHAGSDGDAYQARMMSPKLHIPRAKFPKVTKRNRTPGVPAGGPKALYAPPPKLPMISNHDRHFRAPYNLASGTERYINGEYQYTGYAYDDDDSAYPQDFKRYGNNSANLIEFRVAPHPDRVFYRLTFNTLMHKDTTIATVAFNTDSRASTGSARLPKDPGLPFPGTDQVLTTWGTGAMWSRWTGHSWRNTPLRVSTSLSANQMTIAVPRSVSNPTGDWTATLATGVFDPKTKGWLPIAKNSGNASNIVNLGFRFNECRVTGGSSAGYNGAPWEHQSIALKAGQPTAFAHPIHFGWLSKGKNRDNIPRHGQFIRMAPSFLAGGTANEGSVPTGISWLDALGATARKPAFYTEGKKRSGAFETQFYSPLQPYVVYIPPHYVPGTPTRLTFWLHPDAAEYYGFGSTFDIPKVFGAARNSIMIDPLARSYTNFFMEEEEEALFEAWNDVARHYTLDPTRTVVAGGSGGGLGALNAGTMWPQLFASVVAAVPPGQRGIYVPGVSDGKTVLNNWLPNLRNLPVYVISDMFSELTFYPGEVQNMIGPSLLGNSMEQLKYRYVFRSVAKDHLLIDFDRPAVASWMGDRQVEDRPFHVTYVRQPSNDTRHAGIVHDKSFWLSDIEVRDNSEPVAKGTIDVVSQGFGLSDPDTQLQTPTAYTDSPGNVYVQIERTWGAPKPVPPKDRLVINATNIRSVTIDPKAAQVSCNARLRINSDGPIKVTLRGCPDSQRTTGRLST